MKVMRTDNPQSNPRLQADPNRRPRRDYRAIRADSADPKRDAADRLRAHQDEALAAVRAQHKLRRGATRDDMRRGPSNPQSAPHSAMDADAAAEAIRAQSRRTKA